MYQVGLNDIPMKQGIDLSQNDLLRAKHDTRSPIIKIRDFVLAIFRDLGSSFMGLFYHIFRPSPHQHLDKNMTWKKDSEGLCVMVHGFFARPSGWNHHLAEFEHKHKEIDLLVPKVPKIGDCSLTDAAAPILDQISDYATKNPGKPICIMGHSNAGRIAVWLEEQMRRVAPSTPIKVSVVAGIPFGTDLKVLKTVHADKLLFSKEWSTNADCHSEEAQKLLKDVREPLENHVGERSYEFYATTSDPVVTNLACSLPILNKNENHYLLHGEGHFSILKKVAAPEVDSCVKWMDKINAPIAF